MAEHSAVNRRVVGSSPTWGASRLVNDGKPFCYALKRSEIADFDHSRTEFAQNYSFDSLQALVGQWLQRLDAAHILRTEQIKTQQIPRVNKK